MTKTALDTSVLVAAFQSWHTAHARSLAAVEGSLADGGVPVLPTHVLFETYSVLTRMPRSFRLAPADAFELLHQTFPDRAEIVELDAGQVFELLQAFQRADVSGGAVYDAVIAAAAHRAGAGRLVTLNPRHFERVAPQGLEIVAP